MTETSAQPKAPTDPKELVERLRKWSDKASVDMERAIEGPHSQYHDCPIADLIGTSRAAASLIESLAASVAEYRGLCVDHEQVERNLLRERESLAGELDEAKYAIGAILPYAQDSGWGISSESEWKAALSIARRARCPHPEVHSPENTPCQWCGE